MFLVLNKEIYEEILNENVQVYYSDENKRHLSTFYRKIYEEFLRKFENIRFFLFTLVDLNINDFPHWWLLQQVVSDQYKEPLKLPFKDDYDDENEEKILIEYFLKNDFREICDRKNLNI